LLALLIDSYELSVLAVTDLKGAPLTVRFDPRSVLPMTRPTAPIVEPARKVELHGIVNRMCAIEVIDCAIPPRDTGPWLIREKICQNAPIRDKGAALPRHGQEPSVSLPTDSK